MKVTRLAPRDLWQKLRDRGLGMVGRFMRAPGGLVDVARAPDGWVTTKVSGWRSKRGSHRVVKEPLPSYAVPEPDRHQKS